jgi:hypothetical protein
MSPKRIVGLILVVVGVVALLWGGVFWTDRDTLLDAGPVQITRDEREGFSVPPAVGILAVVAGIALLLIPERRKV